MKFPATAIRLALLLAFAPMTAFADVAISINIAPPALPVYVQPDLPGDGYLWTPGYWAWDGDDYYWVPGTWVLPPRAGLLWTPAWWVWDGGVYQFRAGYWGPSVGYYGGIDYGHGYGGHGYDGGRWDHDRFRYNRAVNRIDERHIRDSYRQDVIHHGPEDHRSYNGGDGGTRSKPSDRERDDDRQDRVEATADQTRHQQAARERPDLRRNSNHGQPPVAATPQPAALDDRRVTPAREPARRAHAESPSKAQAQELDKPDAQRETPQPQRPQNGSRPGEPGPRDREQHDRRPEARPAAEPAQPRQQEHRQPAQPDQPQNGSRPGEAGPRDRQQREQKANPEPRQQEQHQQPAQPDHPQRGSRRPEGGAAPGGQQREQRDQHDQHDQHDQR